MSKWRLTLTGMGAALGLMAIVWFPWADIGYSSAARAISAEGKLSETSHGDDDQQVIEANSSFAERARAIETSFKAAFLFRR